MDYRYDHILIRYGELSLKGKNRNVFIRQLKENIKKALKSFSTLEIESQHDRMYIYLKEEDPNEVANVLSRVFGISSFSFAIKVDSDIDAIVDACLQTLDFSNAKTFKVAARRSDKSFPVISDQINRIVAGAILKNSAWKVDVHHPDYKIVIEVHRDSTYIMTDRMAGAGGYPVGVGGKAMVLLSGGIDSPVAAYLMMKRGVRIECIHFASPPYTSENAQQKVLDLASIVSAYQGDLLVHIVPFTNLQLAIYQHADESYAITLMRRMMMRIAEGLAQKRKALVLATGESVGQVASQTLESMVAINSVVNIPMIRPLVCMDKVEIIELSKKIGTYETSILPYEDCCTIFTPKNPVTKPRVDRCVKYEESFDFESLVQECIQSAESIWIHPQQKEDQELY
ncbi:tRNA uracil 4-sulfurtransferase ThiI [Faecalicoccus acidiformans]|uniref:tRNA uracil 4-sulfurtransferase ThiI n=1 Tax=Faecalicoccus acidiformans TaxID=915173 RepID=UPI0025A3C68C|nr:tRNA uracil 4-sulfurtransferase ThiI [Faecalicoccus acidiformans]MDM8204101.1 tRNA uracil 4-sulfurtransferase ThiI [Faecalicoccus acidiformans]